MSELELTASSVMAATCAEDVFGGIATEAGLVGAFRWLARILHPDRAGSDPAAAEAMARLLELRAQAEKKFADGTWGQRAPLISVEIRTKRLYKNVVPLAAGDLFDIYVADYEDDKPRRAVLKLLRAPSDDDLASAEWRMLQKLWADSGKDAPTFQRYLPKLVETARISIDGKIRRANILRLCSNANTLGEVLVKRPRLDMRDVAWMWRRLLECLSWVHSKGVVHGAILPEHVLIRPADHGARLIGWSCSVNVGEKIKAISTAREAWYPPEVALKQPATPATDLYMVAKIVRALVDPKTVPIKVDNLLSACLLNSRHSRHTSAVEVYQRLDVVLRETYGKPSFRPFSLSPAGAGG